MRLLLAALLPIAALAQAADPPKADAFTTEALDAVRAGLKDPESARFRNVIHREGPHLDMRYVAACGEVNAKNSYGGYTGFTRFVAYRVANYDIQVRIENDDEPRFPTSWRDFCGTR